MRVREIIFVVIFVLLFGCSSSDDTLLPIGSKSAGDEGASVPGSAEGLAKVLAAHGLELREQVTIDGDTGYLAEFTGLEPKPQIPKYCMILTGAPHSLGYQAAYLRPDGAHGMLTDFMRRVGVGQLNMLGIDIDPDSDEGQRIFDHLLPLIVYFCSEIEEHLPPELVAEMRGVVDGLKARGIDDVTYEDVLALNQGVDSTYYFLAGMLGQTLDPDDNRKALEALIGMLQESGTLHENVKFFDGKPQFPDVGDWPRFGCNEFVVGGNATVTGETYHGRDFMFSTGDIYQDAACVMVYLPDNGIPFVSVAPPGFVGQSSGINAEGISIGMDVTQGAAFGSDEGVGCMVIARHVLDTCATLDDAIYRVKNIRRGVPWQYIVADDVPHDTYGCGLVLATGRDDPNFSGPDTLPQWEQWLLGGATISLLGQEFNLGTDYIALLPDEGPEKGLMVRGATWEFPEALKDTAITIPVPDSAFPAYQATELGVYFPEQVEDLPDVLAAANHYILPHMRMTEFLPIIALIYSLGPLPESVWRYETTVGMILDHYENINFFNDDTGSAFPSEGSAGWIIDFLNTQRENWWFYRGQDADGNPIEDVDMPVDGHHVVMNNSTKELRGLFGTMTDPWVGVRLPEFVAWYHGSDEIRP